MGIKTIVDSDGFLIHVGNILDTKFQRILAQSGNTTVDTTYQPHGIEFKKAKWDGFKWVEILPTDMEKWVEDMEEADMKYGLPRYAEDILDGMPDKSGVAQITLDKLQSKKDLRATKP